MGLPASKPRKLPAQLVWARENKDIVDDLRADTKSTNQAAQSAKAKGKRKANTAASDYQAAVKAGFDALPEDERAEWEEKAEEESKNALSEWRKLLDGEADTSPEARQKYVLKCVYWLLIY